MSAQRIALVTPNLFPRTCGVSDYSVRLATELAAMGHSVRLFSRTPGEPHPENPAIEFEAFSAPAAALVAARIAHAVARWGADHVMLQYTPQMLGASRLGSAAGPLIAATARARGARLTVVSHELRTPYHLRPDRLAGAAIHHAQLTALLRLASRFVVTTEARRREVEPLARTLGASDRLRVVPVGSNAAPVPARPAAGRLRGGVFSTLAFGKRFDVVLGAFARIADELPHAELVLLGDLSSRGERARAEVDARIAAHPARTRIRVPGRLPLPAIAAEVSELDVYLFPMDVGATTRSGTLPLPLGSGVPVVAIRGADTDAVFKGDENLVFAEALTEDAFARATLRLARDPALADRVGRGGRTLYEERLTWRAIAQRIVED